MITKPRPIRAGVLMYLLEHRNQHVTVEELVKATGHSREQVRGAIGSLRHDGKADIVSIVAGSVYLLKDGALPVPSPNGKSEASGDASELYESVGKMKDGRPVIRDSEGVLYTLGEL